VVQANRIETIRLASWIIEHGVERITSKRRGRLTESCVHMCTERRRSPYDVLLMWPSGVDELVATEAVPSTDVSQRRLATVSWVTSFVGHVRRWVT